jgi:hypothetical protein
MRQAKLISVLAKFIPAILLIGCVTAPQDAPKYTRAPPAPEGYATVYLYRLGAPPYTKSIGFTLNGQSVLSAPEQAYTWVYVRSRTHSVVANWPKNLFGGGWPDAYVVQAYEPGKSYYFRVSGQLAGPTGVMSAGTMKSMIIQYTPAFAESELATCCRYLPAKVQRFE